MFFLPKCPGSNAISHQKHLELLLVSCLLNAGDAGGRTDDWAYGHVITKISRMEGLPNFLTYGAPLTRGALRSLPL